MASILQIKRRLTGAAGSPAEGGSYEGEFAVNIQDATAPELWVFGGNTTTGTAPSNKGWIRLNPPGVAPRVRGLGMGGDQGSIQATFNNDGINVAPGDIVIYTYQGNAYVYGGPTGAPVTTAAAGDFTSLGSAPSAPQFEDLTGQAGADIGAAWAASGKTAGTGAVFASWGGETYILTVPSAPGTGSSWTAISQDVTTEVVDWTGLAGNPGDLGAAYTAWNGGTGTPDFSASVSIVKFGNPVQFHLLIDPANPSDALSYAAISEPVPSALTYRGNLDVETAMAGTPLAGWSAGDFATAANAAGDAQGTDFTPDGTWPLAGVSGDITVGDLLIYDGTSLNVVSVDIDLNSYVSKSGANAIANDMVMTWTAPLNDGTTIFDGGNADKSKIENVTLDAGTY